MSKLNALVADDIESLRELLKMHLKKFGCRVIKEVEHGDKVIAAIQKTSPDIVFLDINMPGMDGLSILKHLSDNEIHSNVWIISGSTDKSSRDTAIQYGARGFIHKPFNSASLQQVIDEYQCASTKTYQKNKRSVIIADDEPLMRKLLQNMLAKMDCEVQFKLGGGKDVVDILRGDKIPDVTFLDIEMPELNGLEVLNIIKKEKIPTFTVMVSAHGTVENVQTAMNAGADGFVVKPYNKKKIEQVLAKFDKTKNSIKV